MIAAKSLAQTRDLSCRSNASRISTLVKRIVKTTLEVLVSRSGMVPPGRLELPHPYGQQIFVPLRLSPPRRGFVVWTIPSP
jgi:hypothetical protein